MPEPDLIPLEDAVTEFTIGRATLYRYLHSGKLTRYQPGGIDPKTYVDRREIQRLLEPKAVPKPTSQDKPHRRAK